MLALSASAEPLRHGPDLLFPGNRPRPAPGRLRALPDLEPRAQRRAATRLRLEHPPERRLLPQLPGRHPLRHGDCALFFFIKDWIRIVKGLGRSLRDRYIDPDDSYAKLGWLLVVGTIPAGLLGLLLEHPLRTLFASTQTAAIFLFINGLMLFGAEALRRARPVRSEEGMRSDEEIARSLASARRSGSAQRRPSR